MGVEYHDVSWEAMNVLLFGATGMIGQGVLRECLLDDGVESVLAVGRAATGRSHPKLSELVRRDLFDSAGIEAEFAGLDACFFCLGVSSAGMSEQDYSRITFDLTLAVASTLAKLRPGMTFIYVSGAGTDSTGRGRITWARVKGRTENALLALPLRTCIFRPAAIRPLDGIRARTRWYRIFYVFAGPLMGLLEPLFPSLITTTEAVGRAMLEVARHGAPAPILESRDINRVAGRRTLQ